MEAILKIGEDIEEIQATFEMFSDTTGPFSVAIMIENMSIFFSALSFLLSRTEMAMVELVHRVIYSAAPLILLLIIIQTGNSMKKEVMTLFL